MTEQRELTLQKSGITAKEIMKTDLFTVDEGQNFNYVEICSDIRHVRHVPVVKEDNTLVGIVSVRDLLEHISSGAPSYFTPIRDIMAQDLITADVEADVFDVAGLMKEHNVSAVPIVAAGKLLGIITERDFVRLFIDGCASAPSCHS